VYREMQQAVGHVLNLITGIVTLAAVILFVRSLVLELKNRPRYSVRTLLIALTVLGLLLGMGSVSHR
jgi:hypothetical protein